MKQAVEQAINWKYVCVVSVSKSTNIAKKIRSNYLFRISEYFLSINDCDHRVHHDCDHRDYVHHENCDRHLVVQQLSL